jgi:hypothetical protein
MHELEYLPAVFALSAIAGRYFHRIGRKSDLPIISALPAEGLPRLLRTDYLFAGAAFIVSPT